VALALRDLHWTFPPLSGFLGALGGWSFTWIRRYLLPGIGGLLAWAYGLPKLRCALYTLSTAIVNSLGYSPERHAWWEILLIGAGFGATPLILARTRHYWWPIMTAIMFSSLMYISLTFNSFTWKWVEVIIFSTQGFLVAWAINQWRTHGKER